MFEKVFAVSMMTGLFNVMYEELPAPKPKKKK